MLGVLLVFPLALAAFAVPTNRTIDDEWGDLVTGEKPVYSNAWNYGPTCGQCDLHPSVGEAFQSTWHDTTSNTLAEPSVTLNFTGTAIWVYCIRSNYDAVGDITFTNATFELDGILVDTYYYAPKTWVDQFEYNVTVFNRTELSNEKHTLVVTAAQNSSGLASVLLFDWAMYTTDDDDTTPTTQIDNSPTTALASALSSASSDSVVNTAHHGPPVGAIAGGVVGGVAFLALCLFLVICFQRQRAPPFVKGWNSRDIEPFDTTPNPPGMVVSLSDPAARGSKDAVVLSVPVPVTLADRGRLDEKRRRITPRPLPDHERMEREADELRQQVASLRAERAAAGSAAPAPGRIDATESTAVRVPANSRLTHAEITRGLRREMAALRQEMRRLTAETEGVVRLNCEPPPAYM
ncbi:uncharacterized protein B0H18DRAFT_1116631 [Fomitopsis serialis]|uniref:uncharacterized protein n=1 Tax=Fomitopsis serialis TaxID=139415 RepID=UPI00200760EE|nr:uncharacterized protein B0H18DRAFT_1116631 [Neoantrodia serialis]KAH9930924.1 hypothetical protein B0H18DRAFT_1116631 [Neoantrodia serialis]